MNTQARLRVLWLDARIEFWWFWEKLSGRLWRRFCPEDAASYWLDWLPAVTYRRRKIAERELWNLSREMEK